MLKFAANLTMMFAEAPFLERFAAARKAGFQGVEFLFPYDFPAADVGRRVRGQGLTQALFNMPPGDWSAGERGIAALPGREDEFKAGLDTALTYAEATGCKTVHVMAGVVPDGGGINCPFIFNHIEASAYDGWIGCGYAPAGAAIDGLGWLDNLRRRAEADRRS